MPLDTTKIPALEEELRQARGTKPGGQAPRPERIAAIEQEIKTLRKEAERLFNSAKDALGVGKEKKAKEQKVSESKVEKAKEAAAADAPETADAKPAPENADAKSATPADNADATSAPENTKA